MAREDPKDMTEHDHIHFASVIKNNMDSNGKVSHDLIANLVLEASCDHSTMYQLTNKVKKQFRRFIKTYFLQKNSGRKLKYDNKDLQGWIKIDNFKRMVPSGGTCTSGADVSVNPSFLQEAWACGASHFFSEASSQSHK